MKTTASDHQAPVHICGGTGGKFDILEEYRRKSTILKVSGSRTIDNIQGFINGDSVYAEIEHSEFETISSIIYGVGSESSATDIVPWQGFDKEHNKTIPYQIPIWKSTPNGKEKEPVYITFHVIEEDGKIGPPVTVRVDQSSDTGKGIDLDIAEEIGSGPIFDPLSASGKTVPFDNSPAPLITAVNKYSVFSAYIEFEAKDPTALFHVYSVSTQPGGNDLVRTQSLWPNDRRTNWHSMAEMGLQPGDVFYINVWASTPTGYGPIATSDPLTFEWETLGVGTINYNFPEEGYDADGNISEGWTQEEREQLQDFCKKMDPIIREVYDPPAQDMELKVVKDARFNGSNIFYAGTNEIRTSEIGLWQLLTHEILHAFHGHIHFENNEYWKFDSKLMGFEEGFAHAVSYICMNKYGEAHPDDPKGGNGYTYWQPYTLADYDYRNHDYLTTEYLWSPNGHAMGLAFERYEMAASVFFKLYMEDNNFFKIFNQQYYSNLNNNQNSMVSKSLLIELAENSLTQVEGMPTGEWMSRQRILDCKYTPGDKVRLHSYVETLHNEFAYRNMVYHYKTFTNGSDWYHDGTTHHYNDRRGIYEIRKASSNAFITAGEFYPTPSENPPPIERGFAYSGLHLSTKGGESGLITHEDGNHFKVINITDSLELYKIRIIYDYSSEWVEFLRLVGTDLEKPQQMICGAFKNTTEGEVTLTHLDPKFSNTPITVSVNGNTWCAVLPWTFGADPSAPHLKKFPMGRVRIDYKDIADNKSYFTYKNLGFGDKNYGVNLLLIDKHDMQEVPIG